MYETKLKKTSEFVSPTTLISPGDESKRKLQENKQGPQVKLEPRNQLLLYIPGMVKRRPHTTTHCLAIQINCTNCIQIYYNMVEFLVFFSWIYSYMALKEDDSRHCAR